MGDYVIRPATAEDCEGIMELTVELTLVQNLSADMVKITAETLRKDGFTGEPKFKCQLAFVRNDQGVETLAGFALYSPMYTVFTGAAHRLEALHVREAYRGRGIATKLLHAAVKDMLAEGCTRLDWLVLDYNTTAIAFYKKMGAKNMTETANFLAFMMQQDDLLTFANSKEKSPGSAS